MRKGHCLEYKIYGLSYQGMSYRRGRGTMKDVGIDVE